MQAVICALNFIDEIGRVKTADGKTYGFAKKSLNEPEDFNYLTLGLEVSFELNAEGKVTGLKTLGPLSDDSSDPTYSLPDEVSFEQSHLREGFEILDVGRFRLTKTSRNRQRAYVELASLCRSLGGNTILEIKERSEQKTAMGYAFIYYTLTGFAAAAGRPDPQGRASCSELMQSLNHAEIKRIGSSHEHMQAGKFALRFAGAALLLVFAAGYFYSILAK